MAIMDEEKTRISKLLQGLDVQDVKLSERCSDLVKEFHKRYIKEVDEEEGEIDKQEVYENPYKADKQLLEENERKLRELLSEGKRTKKEFLESVILSAADPKRPWRTHSNKEKLLRINNDLKHHHEMASQAIAPLDEDAMKDLVQQCQEEHFTRTPMAADRLRDTVDEARRNLPNFQYRKIENTTATAILSNAHAERKPADSN